MQEVRQVAHGGGNRQGYEFEPEQYVIVSADDFAKIKLESTKVIEIEGFIDAAEVHPTLYDSALSRRAGRSGGGKTYSLLGQALKASGKVGSEKWCCRDREETVHDRGSGRRIMLYQLRQQMKSGRWTTFRRRSICARK